MDWLAVLGWLLLSLLLLGLLLLLKASRVGDQPLAQEGVIHSEFPLDHLADVVHEEPELGLGLPACVVVLHGSRRSARCLAPRRELILCQIRLDQR